MNEWKNKKQQKQNCVNGRNLTERKCKRKKQEKRGCRIETEPFSKFVKLINRDELFCLLSAKIEWGLCTCVHVCHMKHLNTLINVTFIMFSKRIQYSVISFHFICCICKNIRPHRHGGEYEKLNPAII